MFGTPDQKRKNPAPLCVLMGLHHTMGLSMARGGPTHCASPGRRAPVCRLADRPVPTATRARFARR